MDAEFFPRRTEVAIVLDRSGSMESCRGATIEGFNSYVDQIRRRAEHGEMEMRFSLVVFNGMVSVQAYREPLSSLRHLTPASYVPDGSTAMLDAVGRTIDRLEEDTAFEPNTNYLVCIISDGEENSSTDYSYDAIAQRISRLQATKRWTFTYLGANQDLASVSEALRIDRRNMASYQATPTGTSAAWKAHADATALYSMVLDTQAAPAPFYGQEEIVDRGESTD